MLEHTAFASADELVSDLAATCDGTHAAAASLARQARREELRALLHDRAESYRRAREDLAPGAGPRRRVPPPAPAEDGEDLVTLWETVECSALLDFRDALDAELEPRLHATVRRCMEDGVTALERLRALRRR